LPADQGVRWVSGGTGEFEVEQIHKDSRGTDIILHLRDDALEYLESYKVKQIINKYSDHISLPIQMQKEVWQEDEVAKAKNKQPMAKWSKLKNGKPLTQPVRFGHEIKMKFQKNNISSSIKT
jgi:molecular chaperone HtpG